VEIDTATIAEEALQPVTGGFVLDCPNCARWYMYVCCSRYVEGGKQGTKGVSTEQTAAAGCPRDSGSLESKSPSACGSR